MIESIESLQPELEDVALLVKHVKLFVNFCVEVHNTRPFDRIAADVSEFSRRRLHKCSQIQVTRRRRVVQVRTYAGRIWAVETTLSRIRVIDAADAKRARDTSLRRQNPARLPAADNAVQDGICDIDGAASSDRQIVQD